MVSWPNRHCFRIWVFSIIQTWPSHFFLLLLRMVVTLVRTAISRTLKLGTKFVGRLLPLKPVPRET